MTRRAGTRFRLEMALAIAGAVTFVLTLVWKDWIEIVFHVDPDGGSGTAEVAVLAGTAVAAVVFGALGLRTRRRARGAFTSA